jgi:hypothetical protein
VLSLAFPQDFFGISVSLLDFGLDNFRNNVASRDPLADGNLD